MKKMFAALLLGAVGSVWAQATPAGLWKTIDDETKAEKSLVRITDNGGVFTGKVEKILSDKPDAKCVECTDERKGQPVQGMTILRGIKPDASEKGTWVGGDILDPNNGKIYKVLLKLADGGKKLDVRGYIGMPMLGRTQTWLRVE
jgi:uncharacterized protein (DUF2147 family)